ncbi:hypothetical protein Tco_0244003, partial [Tanacetum coccineum]
MFRVHDLNGDEVVVKSEVAIKAGEKKNVVEEVVAVTDVEITLAQALAELKSTKPKTAKVVVHEPEQGTTTPTLTTTTAATTITTASTRPKTKGIIIHEQEKAPTPTISSQPSQAK